MHKFLLSFFAIYFSFNLFANENWVTVDGYAPFSAGKLLARRQALVEAYRQAINAGGIIEVKSTSQASNFSMVADVVKTRTHGYIKSYEVISEGADQHDSSLYKITIKARVVNSPDSGQEKSLASFLGIIGVPKVLFLISEANNDIELSSVESYMAESFRKVGYEVLTADDVKINKEINELLLKKARSGHGISAAKIARSTNADIVVTGKLTIQMSQMSGGTDITANLGNVSLNVKAIIPGNGKVVDVVNARDRFMSVQQSSQMIAKEKAIAKTAKSITEKLKWNIPKYLSQQPRDITLKISNFSFENTDEIKLLLSKIEGINTVELDNWHDKVGLFTVSSSYTGPQEKDILNVIKRRYSTARIVNFQKYFLAISF